MSPKFRGGADDWLDDERSSGRKGSRGGGGASRSKGALHSSQANATVAEVFMKQCRVIRDGGGEALSSYRRTAFAGNVAGELRERSPVAVGDRVRVKTTETGSFVIDGICERTNFLMRPAPDREQKTVHIVAANLDVLVVVASAAEPSFSQGLVDRFLVGALLGGVKAIICVNKIDLLKAGAIKEWDIYRALCIDVFELSAKTGNGMDVLRGAVMNKKAAFCGHSGVGKTSLLASLLENREIGKIGEVNSATGKGRHTTTGSIMLAGPEQSSWIDTPGVRQFGLAVPADKLREYFPEFLGLDCSNKGCMHYNEEGCNARALSRYQSYRRIFESLSSGGY